MLMQKIEKIKRILQGVSMLFLVVGLISCEKESEQADPPIDLVKPAQAKLPTEAFEIGGERFEVELAYTRASRSQGLMYRETVEKNEGMFFVFHTPQLQRFYMKNCLVDLDILFIKENGEIDTIDRMSVPIPGVTLEHYRSKSKVRFVLELAAGTCQRLGLQAGQTITLPKRIYRILPDRG